MPRLNQVQDGLEIQTIVITAYTVIENQIMTADTSGIFFVKLFPDETKLFDGCTGVPGQINESDEINSLGHVGDLNCFRREAFLVLDQFFANNAAGVIGETK